MKSLSAVKMGCVKLAMRLRYQKNLDGPFRLSAPTGAVTPTWHLRNYGTKKHATLIGQSAQSGELVPLAQAQQATGRLKLDITSV